MDTLQADSTPDLFAGCSIWKSLANRLNALKSTGPKTAEGKARSSRNSLKHGLSKIGERPPAELAALIAERLESWRPDYRPEGQAQRWQFERLVAESVRLDACERKLLAARAELAARASESWDDDRAAEVADLGSRLAAQPDRIQPLLLQSRHGVRWLLDRFEDVATTLDRQGYWSQPNWHRFLDLTGLPIASRETLTPYDLHPDGQVAAPGLALIVQAQAALRERLDAYLDDRDSRARQDAEDGLSAADPAPIRLLERYAADARRRFTFHTNELRRMQSQTPGISSPPVEAPEPAEPASTPLAQAPSPRPARSRPTPAASAPPPSTNPAPPEPSRRNEPPAAPALPPNRKARRAALAAARKRA